MGEMEMSFKKQVEERDQRIQELTGQMEEIKEEKRELEQEVMVIQEDVKEMAMQNNRVEQGMISKV